MTEKITCGTCDGSGELRTSHRFDCYDCDGRGYNTAEDIRKNEIERLRSTIAVSEADIEHAAGRIAQAQAKLAALGADQ